MYLDQPLRDYLNDLASSQPAPGGGSAAALSGALGASLASMVARLTLGKAAYAAVQPEIEAILEQTDTLRERFQQLMQADIEAYGRLSQAFKLPRTTSEEVEDRARLVQLRLHEAALVPLEVVESAAALLEHCRRLAQIGNQNVLSDIGAAGAQALSAAQGAAWMVRINLRSLKDALLVAELQTRLTSALGAVQAGQEAVRELVGRVV